MERPIQTEDVIIYIIYNYISLHKAFNLFVEKVISSCHLFMHFYIELIS